MERLQTVSEPGSAEFREAAQLVIAWLESGGDLNSPLCQLAEKATRAAEHAVCNGPGDYSGTYAASLSVWGAAYRDRVGVEEAAVWEEIAAAAHAQALRVVGADACFSMETKEIAAATHAAAAEQRDYLLHLLEQTPTLKAKG